MQDHVSIGHAFVTAAGLGGIGGDDFDQTQNQWQAKGVIRWTRRIARLTTLPQPTDSLDGAPTVVKPLQRPRCTGGVMQRGVQCKIGFHIPLQIVHDWPRASDAFCKFRTIGDLVGNHVPVTRRGF